MLLCTKSKNFLTHFFFFRKGNHFSITYTNFFRQFNLVPANLVYLLTTFSRNMYVVYHAN